MADRMARYAHSPKGAKSHGAPAGEGAAEAEAKKTAGGENAPHADNPDKAGKIGSDPGPDAGEDTTWGVVASRHAREHGDMLKRHGEEMTATHERHHAEAKTMHKRHHDEAKQHMDAQLEAAMHGHEHGKGPELGNAEGEGKKGANV